MRRGPATRIVVGALVRLLGATTVLSLLVLVAGRWTHGIRHRQPVRGVRLRRARVPVREPARVARLRCAGRSSSAAASLVVELAMNRWVPGSTRREPRSSSAARSARCSRSRRSSCGCARPAACSRRRCGSSDAATAQHGSRHAPRLVCLRIALTPSRRAGAQKAARGSAYSAS